MESNSSHILGYKNEKSYQRMALKIEEKQLYL